MNAHVVNQQFLQFVSLACSVKRCEMRTLNVEYRTLNIERGNGESGRGLAQSKSFAEDKQASVSAPHDVFRSMFEVQCSMFNVRLLVPGFAFSAGSQRKANS